MKLRTLALLPLLLIACGEGNKEEIKTPEKVMTTLTMKGSDTMLPVGQKEAEDFMKGDSSTTISVVGGGSGVGIAALVDGTTDIAMSSRDLKTDEKIKLQDKKINIVQTTVAFDALSVIVNPANKVSQLTKEQLEDIFTGKITNWKEIGGENLKIVVYSRESSSGTYEFFKEHVMSKKNYAPSVLSLSSTGAIVQSVSQTKGAISYVGIAYADASVKSLAVSFDNGTTFVLPSIASAKDKSYPVSRPLYLFYDETKAAQIKPFIDYILSTKGQQIVSEVGYVTVN